MSLLDLPGLGRDFQAQLTTTQVPTVGVAATFAQANNKITIAGLPAHGLTFNPAAGVMPNYFVTFSGSTAESGGTLNGNIFRILSIPSATSLVIYGTLTAATVTTIHVIPVFFLPFTATLASAWANGPTDSAGVAWPPADVTGGAAWAQLGANCAFRINYDSPSTAVVLDQYTTPSTGTPGTAPNWTDVLSASSKGLIIGGAPQACLWANGTAGTSTVSVFN